MRWYSLSRRSTSSDQKAPPLAGELSVSDSEQTEGEQLTALGSFKPFPFRHGLRRDTFPACGDSFWLVLLPAPLMREVDANATSRRRESCYYFTRLLLLNP